MLVWFHYETVFDYANKVAQIEKLDAQMASPTFWDNPEKAQEIVQQLKSLRSVTEPLRIAIQSCDDLGELSSMLDDDPTVAVEVETEIIKLEIAIEQSVLATGGGTSTAGVYKVEMTAAQSVAGQQAAQSPYSIHAGFWNAQPLSPSAADAVVSGRVTTGFGQGIRNVRISMSSGDGQLRYALTSSMGFYRFDDVPVGQTYIIEISSKRFRFEPITTC